MKVKICVGGDVETYAFYEADKNPFNDEIFEIPDDLFQKWKKIEKDYEELQETLVDMAVARMKERDPLYWVVKDPALK